MQKLCPNESVEDADIMLRGSVMAPEGFSRTNSRFAAKGLPEENPEGALTLPHSKVLALEAIS